MLVLGIESSCDETGVAIYDTERGLIGNQLHTQIAMHAQYGGVVPELASRDHIHRLVPLTRACLAEAQVDLSQIDAIAYTQGPGLGGALLTGTSFANALAFANDKPVIPVHHLEGHLLSPMLAEDKPEFPFVALLVSGGVAGLAGALEVAGPIGQLTLNLPAGYGFAAIIVAFVGRLHPVGVVFSSLLMSMLYIGGELAQSRLGLPKSISLVFQGLLLFTLLACDTLIHSHWRRVGARPAAVDTHDAGDAADADDANDASDNVDGTDEADRTEEVA